MSWYLTNVLKTNWSLLRPISDTFTLLVYTTTLVAEFFTTSTPHMIAAFGLLNPKLAEGAHLILRTLHKIFKGLLILIWIEAWLILLTRELRVEWSSAREAITVLALNTCEIIAVNTLFKNESICTVSGWTPRYVFLNTHSL